MHSPIGPSRFGTKVIYRETPSSEDLGRKEKREEKGKEMKRKKGKKEKKQRRGRKERDTSDPGRGSEVEDRFVSIGQDKDKRREGADFTYLQNVSIRRSEI